MLKRRTRKKISTVAQKEQWQYWVLCLPSIIKVIVFSYIPLFWLLISFQFYIPRRGVLFSEWVGFQNFGYLLKSTVASRLFINTISIKLLTTIFGLIVSIILGLFLFEIVNKYFLKVSQTVLIFPYFVTWPLVGVLVKSFLSERTGMITSIIDIFGPRIDAYSDPSLWWGIITFCSVWKTAGLSAVTYYAVLTGVDKAIYEAAEIDGASKFKCMRYISLPSLKLMVVLNLIMSSANVLNLDFNMIYYVTDTAAALYSKTDVIETYMFRALRTEGDYSISTAVGLFQGVVGLILTIIANKVSKKISDTSLF